MFIITYLFSCVYFFFFVGHVPTPGLTKLWITLDEGYNLV